MSLKKDIVHHHDNPPGCLGLHLFMKEGGQGEEVVLNNNQNWPAGGVFCERNDSNQETVNSQSGGEEIHRPHPFGS